MANSGQREGKAKIEVEKDRANPYIGVPTHWIPTEEI